MLGISLQPLYSSQLSLLHAHASDVEIQCIAVHCPVDSDTNILPVRVPDVAL